MSIEKTALFSSHEDLHASMVEFAGTWLPVRYNSETEEHFAVRNAAGIFDVSHMGEFYVDGPGAFEFLQVILSNNLEKITIGQAQYSLLLNEHGGIIDDLIVYKLSENKYMLCVNACNIEKDWQWILSQKSNFAVVLQNVSRDFSQIALQGPRALRVLKTISKTTPPARFCFNQSEFDGFSALVAYTGYTGEEGVEIFVANKFAKELWGQLLKSGQEFGLKPCGLAARDSLRLEAGMPLHGQDIDENTTPLEARLSFALDLNKSVFMGKDALIKQKALGSRRKLVGLRLLERGVCRHDFEVLDIIEQQVIGQVTSGGWPPTQKTSIALAYVKKKYAAEGTQVFVNIRGVAKKAMVVVPRFIKR